MGVSKTLGLWGFGVFEAIGYFVVKRASWLVATSYRCSHRLVHCALCVCVCAHELLLDCSVIGLPACPLVYAHTCRQSFLCSCTITCLLTCLLASSLTYYYLPTCRLEDEHADLLIHLPTGMNVFSRSATLCLHITRSAVAAPQ